LLLIDGRQNIIPGFINGKLFYSQLQITVIPAICLQITQRQGTVDVFGI
jgi:hypothetical protein